jgi:peroxiredoxin
MFTLSSRKLIEMFGFRAGSHADSVASHRGWSKIVRCSLILLLIMLVAPSLVAYSTNPWVGRRAPDFTATDLSGNQISLSDYRGKVVLLDFWATWCAGCLMEMPDVKQVYEKYHKDKDFVVIGVSLDVNQARTKEFVKKSGFDWPQVYDGRGWESGVAQLYHVDAIPSTFLIDKKGIIRYTDLTAPDIGHAVGHLVKATAKPEA